MCFMVCGFVCYDMQTMPLDQKLGELGELGVPKKKEAN